MSPLENIVLKAIVAVEGLEDANIYPALLPLPHLRPILCPDESEPTWRSVVYPVASSEGLSFSPIGGKHKLRLFLKRWRPSLANVLRYFVLRGEREAPLPQRCYWGRGLRDLDLIVKRPLTMVVVLEDTRNPIQCLERAVNTAAEFLDSLRSRREFSNAKLDLYQEEPHEEAYYARKTLSLVEGQDTLITLVVHVLKAPLDKIVAEVLEHAHYQGHILLSEKLCTQHNCGNPSTEQYWKCTSHLARVLLTCTCSYREHANLLRRIPDNTKQHILEKYGLNTLLKQ